MICSDVRSSAVDLRYSAVICGVQTDPGPVQKNMLLYGASLISYCHSTSINCATA